MRIGSVRAISTSCDQPASFRVRPERLRRAVRGEMGFHPTPPADPPRERSMNSAR
jgi:hypothetical protein